MDQMQKAGPEVLKSLAEIQNRTEQILGAVGAGPKGWAPTMLGIPMDDFQEGLQTELKEAAAALKAVLDAPIVAVDSAIRMMDLLAQQSVDSLKALEQAAEAVLTVRSSGSLQASSLTLTDLAAYYRYAAYTLFAVVFIMLSWSFGYAYFVEMVWEDNEIAAIQGTTSRLRGCCHGCFSRCGIGCCFWLNSVLLDLLNIIMFVVLVAVAAVAFVKLSAAGGCAGNQLLSNDGLCTSTLTELTGALGVTLLAGPTCSSSDILICQDLSYERASFTALAALFGCVVAVFLPRRLILVRGAVQQNVAVARVMMDSWEEREMLKAPPQDKDLSAGFSSFFGCKRCVSTGAPN